MPRSAPVAMTRRDDPGTPAVPPHLVLVVAVFSVGVSAILIRYVDDVPARTIAFYRLFFTVCMLAPVAFLRHRDAFAALSGRDLVTALGIGVVLAIHFGTWIESLFHTTVASSVIIVSLESILAAIGAAVFLGERLTGRAWAFIGLAFAGVALLAFGDTGGALASGRFPNPLYGDMLAFIGAVAAAVYFLGGRRLRQRVHLIVYVLVVYWSCSVALLLFALGTDAPLTGFSGRTWLLFVLMAIIPTIGGHTLFNWSLRYLPAASVSTSVLGEPLIASLLAALLFQEVPAPLAIAGGVVTLIGILGVIRNEYHPDPEQVGLVEGPLVSDDRSRE